MKRMIFGPFLISDYILDWYQSVFNVLYAQLIDLSDSQLDKNQVDYKLSYLPKYEIYKLYFIIESQGTPRTLARDWDMQIPFSEIVGFT